MVSASGVDHCRLGGEGGDGAAGLLDVVCHRLAKGTTATR